MADPARQAPNFVQQGLDLVKTTVLGPVRQRVREHGEEEYRAGFSDAAGISLEILRSKVADFDKREASPGLNKTEQGTHAQLRGLITELEEGFDHHWERSDSDWRPARRPATRRQEPSTEQ